MGFNMGFGNKGMGKGFGKGFSKSFDGGKKGGKGEWRNTGKGALGAVVPNKLYCWGLTSRPDDAKLEGELKEFFGTYGAVKEILVPRRPGGQIRGTCFVTFEDEAAVEKVLAQGSNLPACGHLLNVDR